MADARTPSLSLPSLHTRAPFVGLPVAGAAGRGVLAADRDGLGIATVIVRKGQRVALTHRVRERFGIELPSGPQRASVGGVTFAGIGPEMWLATCEQSGNAFAAMLKEQIGDLASISDQSDGYAVLRLTGPKLRDTLTKILPIDVHPRSFKPGDVASTVVSHIGVTLWCVESGPDGSPVFDIAMFRSLAADFWNVLATVSMSS